MDMVIKGWILRANRTQNDARLDCWAFICNPTTKARHLLKKGDGLN